MEGDREAGRGSRRCGEESVTDEEDQINDERTHKYWSHETSTPTDMDFNDRLEPGDFKSHINICFIILMLIVYLFRWSQFMVFITSHSDPETRYLHLRPNNAGSSCERGLVFYLYFHFKFLKYYSRFLM